MGKRSIDIACSLLALVVLSPILLVIMVILRCTGEGHVFYRQERVGRRGRKFGLLKFATMLRDSPRLGTGDITLRDDSRVLPVGRFLRKTKLNEIPQIVNVLLGEMSLVGPRPLTPKIFSYYTPEVRKAVGVVRPGLSGVGSIIFRDEEAIIGNAKAQAEELYKSSISPYKGTLELWYLQHQSLWLDIKLLFLTAWIVVFKKSKLPFKILKDLPMDSRMATEREFSDSGKVGLSGMVTNEGKVE